MSRKLAFKGYFLKIHKKTYVFVQTIFLANTSLERVPTTSIYKKGQTVFIVGAENE